MKNYEPVEVDHIVGQFKNMDFIVNNDALNQCSLHDVRIETHMSVYRSVVVKISI